MNKYQKITLVIMIILAFFLIINQIINNFTFQLWKIN
jgi:Na+-translocating ferredoxin:NAD+ oxidoreductase RnfE subunit